MFIFTSQKKRTRKCRVPFPWPSPGDRHPAEPRLRIETGKLTLVRSTAACACARACARVCVCVSVHLCLLRSTVRPPPHSRPRLCHYHLGAPLCYPFTAAPTSPRQLLATAALHLRGSVISRPCYVNEITPCGTSCSWLCSRGVIAEAHPRCPARHGAVPRYH